MGVGIPGKYRGALCPAPLSEAGGTRRSGRDTPERGAAGSRGAARAGSGLDPAWAPGAALAAARFPERRRDSRGGLAARWALQGYVGTRQRQPAGDTDAQRASLHQVAPLATVEAIYVAPDWDPWDRIWGRIVWLWWSRGEHHLTFAICSCDGNVILALGLEIFST